jgi:hypothetical protein
MYEAVERALSRVAARFVAVAQRRPACVLVAALVATLASAVLGVTRLRVDNDPDRMTSPELPFRRTNARLETRFPQLVDNLVVLVEADRAEDARQAAEELASLLARDAAHVSSVFLPGADPFFEEHGLWYADADQLTWLAEEFERAAPLLLELERQPHIATLAGAAVAGSAGEEEWLDALDASALWLEALGRSLEENLAGRSRPVPWRDLLLPAPPIEPPNPQALFVQPTRDFLGFGPAEQAIAAVRAHAGGLEARDGLRVRVTGDVAVLTDEMSMIRWQVLAASLASLVLVTLVLIVTLRSFRLFLATLATLLMGLSWTAGFAALAVGHLNILTTAFAVLYVGLGVDFGIHFGLGFREQRARGRDPALAVSRSGSIVGSSLVVCALTTAIGFYAFVPTSYTGVAELGIISGSGIFLSLVATLTVYPALICLGLGRSQKLSQPDPSSVVLALPRLPLRRPRSVCALAAAAALASLVALPELRFDSDPLNVRDPRVESVQAMNEVLAASERSPWTVEILVDDAVGARALRPRLEALPEVDGVLMLDDFVPGEAEEKARLLDRARRVLEPASRAALAPRALDVSLAALAADVEASDADALVPGLDELRFALGKLHARRAAGDAPDAERLEADLFAGLRPALALLRERLASPPVTRESLPDSLAARYAAPDGAQRVEVFAQENLRTPGALERFADAVRTVRPDAGGAVVGTVEFGRAIMDALRTALVLAVAAIVALLLLLWRSVRFTAIALTPLLLGALFTAATSVALGLSLNFANVIVLPLILGIGVDSGIHLVHRHRLRLPLDADVLRTSTARAVFFSALTSMASFATLGFASHRGMASLAHLLTLGLAMMLICNLVVLPALLTWLDPPERGSAP